MHRYIPDGQIKFYKNCSLLLFNIKNQVLHKTENITLKVKSSTKTFTRITCNSQAIACRDIGLFRPKLTNCESVSLLGPNVFVIEAYMYTLLKVENYWFLLTQTPK